MSRNFKTSQKNRTRYIYYDADGHKVMELIPGENGVTEADIALLHSLDDIEVDEQRRYKYRTMPVPNTKNTIEKQLPEETSQTSKDTTPIYASDEGTGIYLKLPEQKPASESVHVMTLKNPPDPFTDFDSTPLQILLSEIEDAEHEAHIRALRIAMNSLTTAQRNLYDKIYVQRRTNTDIAKEEGVTEAAIRNRLKKMHTRLRKLLS